MRSNRRGWIWAVALLAIVFLGYKIWKKTPPYELGLHATTVQASGYRAGIDPPHIENCPVFPADNIWNTPIDKLEKHPKSNAYISTIGPQAKIHPDFASNLKYGIPFTNMPPGTPPVHIDFEYKDESDTGDYRIPPDAPIEGGGAEGDAHVIVIDQSRCTLYELYAAHRKGNAWTAGSGIIMDLKSNALRPSGKTSADAAGLPIFPGLVRYSEVEAGEINHALRFTAPRTQGAYVWPARHYSGRAGADLPPMGMRFRLRADFDISLYSKQNRVILKALKRYGMFLADNGSAMYLTGVPDKRWDDDDLRKLGGVTAKDFEAVDEADLEYKPNSAQVDPKHR